MSKPTKSNRTNSSAPVSKGGHSDSSGGPSPHLQVESVDAVEVLEPSGVPESSSVVNDNPTDTAGPPLAFDPVPYGQDLVVKKLPSSRERFQKRVQLPGILGSYFSILYVFVLLGCLLLVLLNLTAELTTLSGPPPSEQASSDSKQDKSAKQRAQELQDKQAAAISHAQQRQIFIMVGFAMALVALTMGITSNAAAAFSGFQLRNLKSHWWAKQGVMATLVPINFLIFLVIYLSGNPLLGFLLVMMTGVFLIGDLLRMMLSAWAIFQMRGSRRLFEH